MSSGFSVKDRTCFPQIFVTFCVFLWPLLLPLKAADDLASAKELTARGDFAGALPEWKEALAEATEKKDVNGQVVASLGLANVLQQLGQIRLAEETLHAADVLARAGTDKRLQSRTQSGMGTLLMFGSDPDEAEPCLVNGLKLAREAGDARLTAGALNNLANLHAYQKKTDQALKEYEDGIGEAERAGDKVFAAKMSANLVTTAVDAASWDEAKKWAYRIIDSAPQVPDSHDKAAALLGAGKACVDIFTQGADDDKELRLKANTAYLAAEATAKKIDDKRALSYALGYRAELYKMDGKPDEALALSRHAAVLAQEVKSNDVLFRWQWQIARILALQKKREQAITAYESAVATLQNVRHDMALHFGNTNYRSSFRDAAGSIYFELADLLLQRANSDKTDAEIQKDLLLARDTAEDLKEAELEDYFQDDCANLLKAKNKKIESISQTAAVVYFIPLEDRTEILVELPSKRI